MNVEHVTKNTIFEDLGFDHAEAINLRARADLMLTAKSYIEEHGLTQKKAAELFEVDQPQISRLLQGKIGNFSVDKLLNMLSRVGIGVEWKIAV